MEKESERGLGKKGREGKGYSEGGGSGKRGAVDENTKISL